MPLAEPTVISPTSGATSAPAPVFAFQATIEHELTPQPVIKPQAAARAVAPAPAPAPAKPVAVAASAPLPALVELPRVSGGTVEEAPPAAVPAAPAVAAFEKPVPKAIPVTRTALTAAAAAEPAKAAPTRAVGGSYVVKPGDTLYGIASRHGVSVKALQEANRITRPEALRDGMKLVLPAGR